jgi:hypothetical protein
VGYDLHVTRGDGKPIAEAEWRAYVAADPELELTGVADASTSEGTLRYESPGLARWRHHPDGEQVWFDFRHGEVMVKNPDEATIGKMLMVARALGGQVQGDDGEIYESPGGVPREPRLSLAVRLGAWVARLRPQPKIDPAVVVFVVGQRVRDFRGQLGTVAAIDVWANGGLGRIEVHFDDGRELTFTAVAHGLEFLPEGAD